MRRIPLKRQLSKYASKAQCHPLFFNYLPQRQKTTGRPAKFPVNMYPANIQCEQIQINGGEEITTYFVTPKENTSVKSIIFYIHGAVGVWQFSYP